MGPDRAQNQERLCWRGPAAIYWARLDRSQKKEKYMYSVESSNDRSSDYNVRTCWSVRARGSVVG
jgi:hypothetical protein